MKSTRVVVPWSAGLHLRPAVQLARLARGFESTARLRSGDKIADLRSVLSVLALCATLGTPLDIEVTGEDEQHAVVAVEQVFAAVTDAGEMPENLPEAGA